MTTDTPKLRLETRAGVARLTIDNGVKRNAFDLDMWRALPELIARADADPETRVIVVSGARLDLNYTGTDTIDELWLGGVRKSPGIYSSANGGGFLTGTGTLTVTTGPPSDYDIWAAANHVTGGVQGDDDHDGLSNFTEYAFGLDPQNGASVSPGPASPDPASGTLTYTRRKTSLTGLTHHIWTSTNLINWSEDHGAIQTSVPIPGTDKETVEIKLSPASLNAERLFVRIQSR